MTNYRRSNIAGASYFFTVNLAVRHRSLLTENIALLRSAFEYVHTRHPFVIDAIVILPDHLHAIWTLPEGDSDFALRWRLIKTVFSRGLPHGERCSESRHKKANEAYGNGAIGNISFATRLTMRAMSITSISIRSSMATCYTWWIGRIRRSIDLFKRGCCQRIGRVGR
jgi:REP element-mobilizing transposase RayT